MVLLNCSSLYHSRRH